ncbi:MAG: isoprenylcysteine carboxylmethyltransferase family protein [Clostridia bacterium]|nr:isoprenylcysteine carboxylmethyltransferase family protein [Clostridia bacterium]
MTAKLFFQAILKFFLGVLLVGALIFLPAWTLAYPQGWLFLGILFIPMFAAGIVMMIKNPGLLQRRLDAREKEGEQKTVIMLSGITFLCAFAAAGLCFRFGFLVLPRWVSYAAAAVFLAAYILYAEVLRENEYLSRTVTVEEGPKVIDTGLYGVVRHPMYMTTLFLFLSMPLVLGSVVSFAIMLFYIPIIVKRIKNEEKVLEAELEGYSEYKKKIRYRLIPFVW